LRFPSPARAGFLAPANGSCREAPVGAEPERDPGEQTRGPEVEPVDPFSAHAALVTRRTTFAPTVRTTLPKACVAK
jgi:hypothetical protein